jgi:hypothetical protein
MKAVAIPFNKNKKTYKIPVQKNGCTMQYKIRQSFDEEEGDRLLFTDPREHLGAVI